ncbi:biotin-dependent carboxyltransferase family protein [uncultured Peptoniphilus sp.]|uniref:5-oxoprolinase subunit C family protein n=1 Tax=uncultured Peptoniphilus sp. TaxID=254354 RepID=UPI00258A02B5|nr:biotin-dependent carboxyltransferase family protein [uncultured Peptoniphilus sp.]MDU3009966.1 biotin-dependent carboxyltransferase family protein [Peptoniphilus harei]MDU6783307.1 biotin-dependent carboxyltransferase family protein [Peptoniphilus harei]
MSSIDVINGGILTTIQDSGRYGYQELGIPTSGVMDDYNYRLANILVGNKLDEAVFEMTFFGPTLKFNENLIIAITGSNMNPKINGELAPMYETIKVKKGDTLQFGKVNEGIRSYLAFGGSIDVPIVNGSKSTHIKTKMGGIEGRALKAKDEINIKKSKEETMRKIPEKYIPKISHCNILRIVLGPQDDFFTEKGIHDLFRSGGYQVTKDFDRMGIRLKGTAIEHKETADIISDGTTFGSIQVPANGQPIILVADRQTTGGYTKIGNVITADLHKLAQMTFLDKVLFQEIKIEEAQKLAIDYKNKFDLIKKESII